MKRIVVLFAIFAIACMLFNVFAQASKKKTSTGKFKYVGVKKCKLCHKGFKKGKIFELWKERKHSQAYVTLASEHSKEVAKKAGVKGDPQKAPECLICHVTAYAAPADQKKLSLTLEEGISCEACHGPGSEYKKTKIMKDVYNGNIKGDEFGLIEPGKVVCLRCHNKKSPTFKELKYKEALKIIAHPVPKK